MLYIRNSTLTVRNPTHLRQALLLKAKVAKQIDLVLRAQVLSAGMVRRQRLAAPSVVARTCVAPLGYLRARDVNNDHAKSRRLACGNSCGQVGLLFES